MSSINAAQALSSLSGSEGAVNNTVSLAVPNRLLGISTGGRLLLWKRAPPSQPRPVEAAREARLVSFRDRRESASARRAHEVPGAADYDFASNPSCARQVGSGSNDVRAG